MASSARARLSLALIALAVAAATVPLGRDSSTREADTRPPSTGVVLPLTRRALRQGPPVTDSDAAVFDPTFPVRPCLFAPIFGIGAHCITAGRA